MNADRLARLDRADEDQVLLDPHDFAEVDARRRQMADEFAKPDVPREAGDGVVASGNGPDMAAMGNGVLRRAVVAGKLGELPKLLRNRYFREHRGRRRLIRIFEA